MENDCNGLANTIGKTNKETLTTTFYNYFFHLAGQKRRPIGHVCADNLISWILFPLATEENTEQNEGEAEVTD